MYLLRPSHLNHHFKSEDSREHVIQILENLHHRMTAEMNLVTDADKQTSLLCAFRGLKPQKLSTHLSLCKLPQHPGTTNMHGCTSPQLPKACPTRTYMQNYEPAHWHIYSLCLEVLFRMTLQDVYL